MMRYRFFEHTADAKFRAYGKTIEEQFANAAIAMTAIMFDPEEIPAEKELRVEAAGSDLQQLLYNWLEELLFILDTKKIVVSKVKKIKINKKKPYRLTAVVSGAAWKEKFEQRGEVKAATYAEMEITKGYVQAVVDI